MGIELAVSPSTKTPGLYLSVNLLSGASTPGGAPLRALLIAPKSSSGSATTDTLYAAVSGPDAVKELAGPGTQAHLAAVRAFGRYGLLALDYIAPPASAGVAATGTVTLGGSVTEAMTITVTIKGVPITYSWAPGVTPTQAATAFASLINAATDSVPVTASPSSGTITVTAKYAGTWGNDIKLTGSLANGAGGTIAVVAMASGTLEPDIAAALTMVSVKEYPIIVYCASNADAVDAGGTSNVSKLKSHILLYNSGLDAKLQTAIVASTSASTSGPKAGAVKINDGTVQHIYCQNAQELPCEFAAFEMADRILREGLEYGNPNRIGTVYEGFLGAVDKVADQPSAATIEDLLNNGISPISYTAQEDCCIVAPITTHSQDTSGNPDFRIFYVTEVTAAYTVARDLRTAIPQEFYQVRVMKDQPPGGEPLPPKTVEERDIKAFDITRLRFFQSKGTIRKDRLDEAIANGTLIVQVDASDPSQVDHVIPLSIVKPLAKHSVVAQKNA